jgi:preprotein translocase subunit SecA
VAAFWREGRRAVAPHAERADDPPGRIDAVLLSLAARVRQPFGRDARRAARFAELVEREQPAVDLLDEAGLLEAARAHRALLLRHGFTFEASARAFAFVRAASARTLGMKHFPVQVMGGYVMLSGMIAEMATGEGKTLTATLPAATVALAGIPVHVVTVNDYLASRDAEWMGPVYRALGLSVGVTAPNQSPAERRSAYAADVCYCTNKDLGFDYLRDGLALDGRRARGRLLLEKMFGAADRRGKLLLRGLHFGIVDEIDSILVDEARTPLIIAGAGDQPEDASVFRSALDVASRMVVGDDFLISAADRMVTLTEQGRARLKSLADLLPLAWRSLRAREEIVTQALSALHLFERDTHYLVRDGKVQIVDEYTGRVMADRSWERGLHQLVEAKEGCDHTERRSTLARITYQRLFRRYLRVGGMSGTVLEVAPEMDAVYGLRTVCIPPNRPSRRIDKGTRLYATRALKWAAVASAAESMRATGRPVLIGTRSVAASEELAAALSGRGLEHQVLNARQDEQEAAIVAAAGAAGRITVATNMAGRGTDIHLDADARTNGGLHVILTEFHESKRIDRQLYGRCARQGDPGSCEAIVSLEDELFVRHASASAKRFALTYGEATEPLPDWVARTLRTVAQTSAEWINAQVRRSTVALDRKLETALGFAGRSE